MKKPKEQCYFSQHGARHIDYKDTEILKKFLNSHGRLIKSRYTSVCSKHQRELARAVKRARFMALIPYVIR